VAAAESGSITCPVPLELALFAELVHYLVAKLSMEAQLIVKKRAIVSKGIAHEGV
jgi:hypothetical protein